MVVNHRLSLLVCSFFVVGTSVPKYVILLTFNSNSTTNIYIEQVNESKMYIIISII
jgi:hypothetical protein